METNEKNVTVSVIIPSYNSVRFVTEAIDSVLSQSFKDLEIVVVDDGSTDDTKSVLTSRYGDTIRYLYKENGGVSNARNHGIGNSTGKYVAFLDADDLWMREKLERQIELMESDPEIGLCYTSAEVVDESLNTKGYIEAKQFEDSCEGLLLNMNILILSSSLVRRDIIAQTNGFDPNFSTCADKEYWLRLSLLAKFAAIPDYLVKYRDVTGSMSSNPGLSKKDTLGVLEKFFGLPDLPERYLRLKRRSFSNNLMIVAGEFFHNREYRECISCVWNAIRQNPGNIIRPLGLPVRMIKRLFLKSK